MHKFIKSMKISYENLHEKDSKKKFCIKKFSIDKFVKIISLSI